MSSANVSGQFPEMPSSTVGGARPEEHSSRFSRHASLAVPAHSDVYDVGHRLLGALHLKDA